MSNIGKPGSGTSTLYPSTSTAQSPTADEKAALEGSTAKTSSTGDAKGKTESASTQAARTAGTDAGSKASATAGGQEVKKAELDKQINDEFTKDVELKGMELGKALGAPGMPETDVDIESPEIMAAALQHAQMADRIVDSEIFQGEMKSMISSVSAKEDFKRMEIQAQETGNLDLQGLGQLALEDVNNERMLAMLLKMAVLGKDMDGTDMQSFMQVASELADAAILKSQKKMQRAMEKLQEAMEKMEKMSGIMKILMIVLIVVVVVLIVAMFLVALVLLVTVVGMKVAAAIAVAAIIALVVGAVVLAVAQAIMAIAQAAMNLDYALTMNDVKQLKNRAKMFDLMKERAEEIEDKMAEGLDEVMKAKNDYVEMIQGRYEEFNQTKLAQINALR